MLGVIEMLLVIRRRTQGFMLQDSWPSLTICPAIVHTIPAEVPERRSARAKIVPAIGAIVEDRSSWMPKRSALSAPVTVYRDAPATIRMALLTKRAKVKSEMLFSIME
jgi:hypothetical protein